MSNNEMYRQKVEELERMNMRARIALNTFDLSGLYYWIQAMDEKTAELADFMATHTIGE